MVYQPTDTTQLGFYYQHVPTWQPQPDRLPARPIPSQWNIVPPPVSAAQFNHGYGYGHGYGHGFGHGGCRYGNCQIGYVTEGTIVQENGVTTSPTPTGSVPETVQPIESGTPGQPVPPVGTPQTPAPLPYDASLNQPGAAPNRLPTAQAPTTSSIPLLPAVPSPSPTPTASSPTAAKPLASPMKPLPKTDSAASGHIRRIGS